MSALTEAEKIKEFTITKDDDGVRLDRFVSKAVPALPSSLVQKYIRIKRIKVANKAAKRDYRLSTGDSVQMYINDEYFAAQRDYASHLKHISTALDILYEDDNIMLINKPAGILCHSADGDYKDNIISRVQAYLYKNGQWHPRDESSFVPALCNRIDRNTTGIVIAAKNAQSLRIICEKIRNNEIDKYYLAIVHGSVKQSQAVLEGYIFKDAVKNRVYVRKDSIPGAKTAVMEYKLLDTTMLGTGRDSLSLLECKLITGRTHQIRAQLASIGHPLLGDGKYGRGDLDKPLGAARQALCSYKIVFSFRTDGGMLAYLNGQSVEIKDCGLMRQWQGYCV